MLQRVITVLNSVLILSSSRTSTPSGVGAGVTVGELMDPTRMPSASMRLEESGETSGTFEIVTSAPMGERMRP